MEKIQYPLVYYTLPDGKILAYIVGSDNEFIDEDLKSLKTKINTHIKKMYKKFDEPPYEFFSSFKMKTFDIAVRPVIEYNNRSFPYNQDINVPVEVIYGPTNNSDYACYLPSLDISFYFHDIKLLKSLVLNAANNKLTQKKPAELFRLINQPRPQLDSLILRVNYNKLFKYNNNWQPAFDFAKLESMAERFPQSKKVRKRNSRLPDVTWGLEHYIDQIQAKIEDQKVSILVVGKSGVGKSAVLRQAMKRITARHQKNNTTFWKLIPQRITAKAKYLGEWQKNVEELIEELEFANGVLWVSNIIQLIQAGGEGAEDSIGAFLISYLRSNKVQLLGEVTPAELDIMRRALPGFVENFQLVKLEQLSSQRVKMVMEQFAAYTHKNLKISFLPATLDLIYRLLDRYYPYTYFPGKAVNFLGEILNEAVSKKLDLITVDTVIRYFVSKTGMPELFLRDDLALEEEELVTFFSKKIIGQPSAIKAVVDTIKIFKTGLNNPSKPIVTMLFAGPTGVGKTACTKTLANYFFGKGNNKSPLVRIDMSEFQHPGQLSRFIGGNGQVGKLVQEIRERPFSVLLLDEIEKADPSIFDALLSVLDEGRLVDAYGRVTNFRNTIIIMTSNLGVSNRAKLGFGDTSNNHYEAAIRQFFRPEFVNRIDKIIPFSSLEPEHIIQITDLELTSLSKREGFEKRGLELAFTETLKKHLATVGYNKRLGVRPLQRALEHEIIAPLARWLLTHPEVINTKLIIDRMNGELTIEEHTK